jgi:hypothetical protein
LLDISDSGAAVLVRGHLEPGFYVKVQTMLGGFPVAVCGEIKAANVHPEKQITVLHIEAIPLSKASRIRILAYVLGLTKAAESPNAGHQPPPLAVQPAAIAEDITTVSVPETKPFDLEQLEESK